LHLLERAARSSSHSHIGKGTTLPIVETNKGECF